MNLEIQQFSGESDLAEIQALVDTQLSEPYSVYTYRYFVRQWPKVSFLARYNDKLVGAIVCKLDKYRGRTQRGYIAMLVVVQEERRSGIGSKLVKRVVEAMTALNADEIVLETEVDNPAAVSLYRRLGFYSEKRLTKYYLNGGDAFRLKYKIFHEQTEDDTNVEIEDTNT